MMKEENRVADEHRERMARASVHESKLRDEHKVAAEKDAAEAEERARAR
jgi:hypothetical protein